MSDKNFNEIIPQIEGSSDHKPQTKDWKFVHHHPEDQIIGDLTKEVKTKSLFKDIASCDFVSEIEPKTIEEALTDDDWIIVMEEELHQFTKNNDWTIVPKPQNKSIIGTR